ncbi:hypothetical protein AQUCO_01700016v1 [Aquilegia coerulea]|uniref:Uncharacterized protein n=1 Tax=Aquilegia coerulea TaxID=218851 RepID=A0A2G5DKQ3_AQUCA|nr:hypothetical protein AQUCO_01700016v1 [Aquilegia coerulea]
MGNQLGISGSSSVSPRGQLSSIQLSSDEVLAYQDACQNDQDVRKFDAELQIRTTRAISALVAEVHKPHSFSLDLLKEVTGSMVETDQQVLAIILESKKDVWKNPELFSLVDDYYQTSLHTLDFCNNLDRFLNDAKSKQIFLRIALQRLGETEPGEDDYKKAIEDLGWFRSAETHFTEELLKSFEIVYCEHLQMLQRLQAQRVQLDKKLKHVKSWRKTATIIFAATFIIVLVCSIVATAIAAPPLVTAMVTAVGAAAAWIPTENWFKRLSRGFEDAVQEQREVVSSMQAGTLVAIRDLDNIKILVERLATEMADFIRQIDDGIALGKDAHIHLVLKDIENKVDIFSKNVDELGEYVDTYTRNIRQARAVVQQRILNNPKAEIEPQVMT